MNCWNTFLLFLFFTLTNFQPGRCLPYLTGLESEGPFSSLTPLSAEVLDKWLKEPCMKNGGKAAYDNFMPELKKSQKCVEDSGSLKQPEMTTKNNLEDTLHNYCKRLPVIKDCMSNLWIALEPCLPESERGNQNVTKSLTDTFMDFFCLKDGDYLVSFMNGKGPECIAEKSKDLFSCVNSTLAKYPSLSEAGKKANWSLVNSADQDCQAMYDLEKCVFKELKTCEKQTASDFAGTLFKMLNEKSSCKQNENQLKK